MALITLKPELTNMPSASGQGGCRVEIAAELPWLATRHRARRRPHNPASHAGRSNGVITKAKPEQSH